MIEKHPDYKLNVFINCPFDDKYFNLLQTILFTICYFGFNPRISLEESDSGRSRLDKIVSLIKDSKYSIHDLSRLQAKSVDEYYRLNMPFELGIDYGLRKFDSYYSDKRSLILETNKYEYMKAISDINGFDIKHHKNNPVEVIKCLRSWFSETVKLENLNNSDKIYTDFIQFNTDLYRSKMLKYFPAHNTTDAELFAKKEIEEMTMTEFIREIKKWVVKKHQQTS
ncbi:MAG: hypothetical protein WBG46_10685 [Nonlabens sp.]